MLSKHKGDCRYPHGHSQTVEVVVAADSLDENDMVCDFKALKEAVMEFLQAFDHAMCVNTDDPLYKTLKARYGKRVIGFRRQDPTAEVLAKTLFETVEARLGTGSDLPCNLRLVRLRVNETATNWAEYAKE